MAFKSCSSFYFKIILSSLLCIYSVLAELESADDQPVVYFPPKFKESSDPRVPTGHLQQFGLQRPPDGPVEEYTQMLHPEEFWNNHASKNKPAVFRGAISRSPAIPKWTDEYLKEKYGDLDVLIELKKENRSFSARRMELKTFIEHYNEEDVYVVTVLPDPMRAEVQVPSCLLCGSFVEYIHETNFWMSSGGTSSLVHFDADHILHCLIAGRKDWMVMQRKDAEKFNMEDRDIFSGSGFTKMNVDKVDLFKYPHVANISWNYTTLLPGDCLFLPSEYIHQVRSYVRSISVTMLFTANPDESFNPHGCEKIDLNTFTTLDKVHVHWTYKKGDQVIEMGYMNVEMLRQSLLQALRDLNSTVLNEELFVKFWTTTVKPEEAQADPREVFKHVIDFQGKGVLTLEDIFKIPQQNFKDLARAMDPPHGPEKSGKFTEAKLLPDEDNNDEIDVEIDSEETNARKDDSTSKMHTEL